MSDDPQTPDDPHTPDEATTPREAAAARAEVPDMTRERARSERRDLDKERGEPLAGGAGRGGPRALRTPSRPVPEWTSKPRILVTNDDGVESRGLLALKQALEEMGEVTVVAPDTNQSAVGHQKTLMRPLRVRERTLADGGWKVVRGGDVAEAMDGAKRDQPSAIVFRGTLDDAVAQGVGGARRRLELGGAIEQREQLVGAQLGAGEEVARQGREDT